MAIEEKDNRQHMKLSLAQAIDIMNKLSNPPMEEWSHDLADALQDAVVQCVDENKAQEILIVIDKGF